MSVKRIITSVVVCIVMFCLFSSCKKDEAPTLYQKYGTLMLLGEDEFKLMTDDNETLYGTVSGIGENYNLSNTRFNIVYYIKGNTQSNVDKEYDVDVINLLSVNTSSPYYSSDFQSEDEALEAIGDRNMDIYNSESGGVWLSRNDYAGKSYLSFTADLRYDEQTQGHRIGFLIDEERSTENELYILAKHRSSETGVHDNYLIYPVACDITERYDLNKYSAQNPLTVHLVYFELAGAKQHTVTVKYPME